MKDFTSTSFPWLPEELIFMAALLNFFSLKLGNKQQVLLGNMPVSRALKCILLLAQGPSELG